VKTIRVETAVERFVAREAMDRATRRVMIGVLGSPAVAAAWAFTCARAREFEAGRLIPATGRAFEIIYDYAWVALHAPFGVAGLHAAFGSLVLVAAGIGLRGWVEARALRRALGDGGLRELRRSELASASAALKAQLEAEGRPPPRALVPSQREAFARAVAIARIAPWALVALTLALVWIALRT
jgi:hypothetical protein